MDAGDCSALSIIRLILVQLPLSFSHIRRGCAWFFAALLSGTDSRKSEPKYGGMMIVSFLKTFP
jgi:hypothetical protein